MATQVANGSQACTLDTEHSLTSTTTPGIYRLAIDTNAMVDGTTPDRVRVRVKEKVLSGSTARYVESWDLEGAQYLDVWKSEAIEIAHYGEWTIEQYDGTGRTFDWSLRKL